MRRFGNAVQQYYGRLILTPPAGSVALSVPGISTQATVSFSNTTFGLNVGLSGSGENIYTTAATLAVGTAGAQTLGLYTNSILRTSINSAGNVSVAAPTSGVAFAVSSTSTVATATFGNINIGLNVGLSGSGENIYTTAATLAVGTAGAQTLGLYTNSLLRMNIGSAGNVVISAPTSGTGLDARTIAGQVAAIFHTPSDNQVQIDCLVGGQFSTLEFTNNAVIKSQVLWDNTNSFFNLATLIDSLKIDGATGGVTVGSPTGSFKGVGTVNAQGLFVNGVAVSTGSSALTATKAALTARASTTTLTNDPDLVVAIPGAGTYQVEVQFNAYCATTGNGISANLNYSGSFTQTASLFSFITSNGLAITGNAVISSAVGTTLIQSSAISTTINGSTGVTVLHATLVATGAGNLGFAWAQTASGVAATNVGAGSRMVVTKIA